MGDVLYYGIKTLFLQSIIFAWYEILGQNRRNEKVAEGSRKRKAFVYSDVWSKTIGQIDTDGSCIVGYGHILHGRQQRPIAADVTVGEGREQEICRLRQVGLSRLGNTPEGTEPSIIREIHPLS